MINTVGELIGALEDYDPETPLRLAVQPSYPLAYYLGCVAAESYQDPDQPVEEYPLPCVWLLQGDHTERPYDVPADVFEQI